MTRSREPRRALDGVRVLALETSLSGPHATKILADMGAEVVMIEKPGAGNVIRTWDTAVKGMSSASQAGEADARLSQEPVPFSTEALEEPRR